MLPRWMAWVAAAVLAPACSIEAPNLGDLGGRDERTGGTPNAAGGTGGAALPVAKLSVERLLDFGSVEIGSYRDAHFTIENTGDADAEVELEAAPPFRWDAPGVTASAGRRVAVRIEFRPEDAGTVQQLAKVRYEGGEIEVLLEGAGYEPCPVNDGCHQLVEGRCEELPDDTPCGSYDVGACRDRSSCEAGVCTPRFWPDGTWCSTACGDGSACAAGSCEGSGAPLQAWTRRAQHFRPIGETEDGALAVVERDEYLDDWLVVLEADGSERLRRQLGQWPRSGWIAGDRVIVEWSSSFSEVCPTREGSCWLAVDGQPIGVHGDTVLSLESGQIVGRAAVDGAWRWEHPLPATYRTAAFDGGTLFVASQIYDRTAILQALDVATGELRWEEAVEGSVQQLVAGGGSLFLGGVVDPTEGFVSSLGGRGELRWAIRTGVIGDIADGPHRLAADRLFLRANDALDPATGELLFRLPFEDLAHAQLSLSGDTGVALTTECPYNDWCEWPTLVSFQLSDGAALWERALSDSAGWLGIEAGDGGAASLIAVSNPTGASSERYHCAFIGNAVASRRLDDGRVPSLYEPLRTPSFYVQERVLEDGTQELQVFPLP